MKDILAIMLWLAILLSPLISLFLVKRLKLPTYGEKVATCLLFTAFLVLFFFIIAWGIFFSDGMGPS